MIYNMEPIDRMVDKIVRDLAIGQDEIPYADYIEWMADGLQHIGAYYQFAEKECTIIIDDYQGLLPCDLYKVIRLIKGCSYIPSGEGGFYGGSLTQTLSKLGVNFDELDAYERYAIVGSTGLQRTNHVTSYSSLYSRLNHNKNLIGNPITNQFTTTDYNINFNKITTGFRYGILNLQYLALPIDKKGWPLVPDDVSFRDALFWKVAYHISMRNPRLLNNPRMQDMEYCKQKWNYYCVQARAAANMPDLAMTERFANNWLRLFNTTDDSSDYYRSLGKKQTLDLNGRH